MDTENPLRVLLDTSALIDLHHIAPQIADRFPGASLGISVITIGELHFGVLKATAKTRPARLAFLTAVSERYRSPFDIDAAVARKYGALADSMSLAKQQPRRRANDLWIAATAAEHNLALVTRDNTDFNTIEDHLPALLVT